MCGRFTQHHSPGEIAARFGVTQTSLPIEPAYNIAPTQPVAVITQDGDRRLETHRWGLIPSWSRDPDLNKGLINARAETLAEKPSFKYALTRRRCLIPADGFYEWKKESSGRQPMYMRLRDGNLFAFAGLWEEWQSPDGSPLRTCAIITVAPNELLAPIHNRMPAILTREQEAVWLDPTLRNPADVLPLLQPYSAERMEAYPVSRRVNAPVANDPECIQPLTAH